MKRATSLDALRGLTIAMMVLCGTIVNWVLPDWMSHCQVPPSVGFDPSIYGITWVDLVFPFFLFAMGAAMPFSVGSRLERGTRRITLCVEAVWRGLKLTFFAIFIQNCYPWVVAGMLGHPADPQVWGISLLSFAILFLIFSRWPGKHGRVVRTGVPALGFVLACGLMWWIESHVTFETAGCTQWDIFKTHLDHILYKSNIIILLLGNMAAFGTIIYLFTMGNAVARVALLPFLMAILLCAGADGSWQKAVYDWTPAPWLFEFRYLKYLFIVIPGTIAGEYLRRWIANGGADKPSAQSRHAFSTAMVALLSLAIIVINVTLLFGRHLVTNFWLTIALTSLAIYFAHRLPDNRRVISHLVKAGAFALILGLFFEAYEGGIRKDDSTYSYYFVTSGLAFYCLSMLVIVCDVYRWRTVTAPFALAGKNPMIAYVAPQLFLFPLMNLCGVGEAIDPWWASTPLLGLLRGVLFTALAIALAAGFSKLRLYWRT